MLERCLEQFQRPLQQCITSPQTPKIAIGKTKNVYSCLAIAKLVGQKNRNGKPIAVLFRNVFYECIEGKSGICSLLAMFIGGDRMVDLMIIYIEKTIAKALDINDIIKKFMGMSIRCVQISQQIIKFNHLLEFENKMYIWYFHTLRSTPP